MHRQSLTADLAALHLNQADALGLEVVCNGLHLVTKPHHLLVRALPIGPKVPAALAVRLVGQCDQHPHTKNHPVTLRYLMTMQRGLTIVLPLHLRITAKMTRALKDIICTLVFLFTPLSFFFLLLQSARY